MLLTTRDLTQNTLRAAITAAYRTDENACVDGLLNELQFSPVALERINQTARRLVEKVRAARFNKGGTDAFMYQYDLSSQEGVAVMCLAEALLRVPDADTANRLIKDKICAAEWESHLGKSRSLFVNASTWGLVLTGKIFNLNTEDGVKGVLGRLLKRQSDPVIRKAVGYGMKILSKQFVMGRTIEEAVKRAVPSEKIGYRYSYDMLGEAARTADDAQRYFDAYSAAIDVIGKAAADKGAINGPGISVKLSALYPRYEHTHYDEVMSVLVPRLLQLCQQAKPYNMGVTVDAEEADRLDLSLDIIEAVFSDPSLQGWEGFGLAVQAYQKRALPVIDWIGDLARRHGRRIMVRLVKGAYWDAEIKRSQEAGLAGYPVYTRKANTDVSYLACAKKMLRMTDVIYPRFATHNAYSVAAILEMMGDYRDFEFQCLHGMGQTLYDSVVGEKNENLPCRVYAPVGSHEDLLPYLVRRLLENGANTSFVNHIVDETIPMEDIIADPVAKVRKMVSKVHPNIPLPRRIYGPTRTNARGIDFSDVTALKTLNDAMVQALASDWLGAPLIDGALQYDLDAQRAVRDPAHHNDIVGSVTYTTPEQVKVALAVAEKAAEKWDKTPVTERTACLRRMADLLEAQFPRFMAILVREAGKTLNDALLEVREAVDFCRYYAERADITLANPTVFTGPTGEANYMVAHGRGVIVCISPWNFPLAIFLGQVTAALAAGNAVIAKPAEQTPLVAIAAVQLLHEAGVPGGVVQCLPGKGSVIGATLIGDERVKGVQFTGSTETATLINRSLAQREGAIVPLIAETGGQNAMIVDSSALTEQVVSDVLLSAFGSAGQRCSALRVLYVQDVVADRVITMLKGAMDALMVGDPMLLNTDVGPVIDEEARHILQTHFEHMTQKGQLIHQVTLSQACEQGAFFAPCAFEIGSINELQREVFGPFLHVVRYKSKELPAVLEAINGTGYGLTLGIHSRIDSTIEYIQSQARVGNLYVNRSMTGAVVGVQPFGGEGLSGTGPKAGGPHYLDRLCTHRAISINTTAAGGNASLMTLSE
ncbi:MAG: bifunctional proline dehydrogenase/L-glutamate gamma-semialdehyde dehydrogenase PutA [Gammaproteobacteria bacterium]